MRRWLVAPLLLIGSALPPPALPQTRTITGTISDSATGAALEGASILLLGTRLEAVSTGAGRFSLSDVPAGDMAVEVRLVGYRRREVPLPAGETELTVRLVRDPLRLEEPIFASST